ncbi:hypothetical protein BpHYR1_019047 [Brachionus plicatilis]|uniref:Uncharacterized protein n=1 Tax=Brachionus plicatilis TaxID=10195 RepID=A0A3M7P4F8_BRAPC|nr:hypothetical protein BpHYR1_019047 [Brachionus plicatilis]
MYARYAIQIKLNQVNFCCAFGFCSLSQKYVFGCYFLLLSLEHDFVLLIFRDKKDNFSCFLCSQDQLKLQNLFQTIF